MNNLKLICLNTAANRFSGILEFFEHYKNSIDIFCLQETLTPFAPSNYPESLHRTEPFYKNDNSKINLPLISNVLDNHQRYFSPHVDFFETFALEGNSMFVKSPADLPLGIIKFDFGSIEIFSGYDRDTNVTLQWMLFGTDAKSVIVTNVHGLWEKSLKTDTRLKLEQSRRIAKALEYLKVRFGCEFVVTGDFNLLPSTESISKVESLGLTNLIKDFNIVDTRGPNYAKEIRFADYIFVSPGINVDEFKVLPDAISDHLPLYLSFSF